MLFSELKIGQCFSFIRTDKDEDAQRCYINIIRNDKKRRLMKYNVVMGKINLEYHCQYKKNEGVVHCHPISLKFFVKKLNQSKDFMTGIPYKGVKTKTVIKETRECHVKTRSK
jgi:hypothetical protein